MRNTKNQILVPFVSLHDESMKASTKLSLSVSKNLILCLDFCRVLESKADAVLAAEHH